MTEFRLTFGQQYGAEEYGADPHPVLGYAYAHKDGWVSILAATYEDARGLVEQLLGRGWSNLYDVRDIEGWDWKFPHGELLRLIHPSMRDLPVALLRTVPPINGQDALVTVWGAGSGELAHRQNGSSTWGPPTSLEPAHRGAGA